MEKKLKRSTKSKIVKVPVVMQMEALECGAACIAMVVAYYEKWIPLEQVRRDCGVSRNGSNAKNMIIAAKSYGLNAEGYKYDEPKKLFEEGTFPCIIHWNFNHFVVCCGKKGDYVYLNDPARGSVRVSLKEFDRAFTGIVLFFSTAEGFEQSGKRKSVAGFALNRLNGAKTAICFVVITTLIGYLFNIINPVFSRFFMDRLLTGENSELLFTFLVLLGIVTFLQIVVSGIQSIYSLKINGKLAVIGSSTYMWKLLHLPMNFFSQRMSGDIQLRKNENESIAKTLIDVFSPLVLNSFMMVFYLVVMIRYSLLLSLVGIISILINAVSAKIISNKRINITRALARDTGKLAGITVSGVEMIETIKASGAENGFFEKWANSQAMVNASQVEYIEVNAKLEFLPDFIATLSSYIVLAVGVFLAINGQFTLGMIMTFQSFLMAFTSPATQLISAGQDIQEMRTNMERIEDVMEYPEDDCYEAKAADSKSYSKLKGKVELKNITFGYEPLGEPLIKDFSMKVEPGHTVAFVGASGCGKSTLSKLISGLNKPWSGEVLFDDTNIKDIDRNVLTGSLAVVDQDIILFDDTIAANIKMWDETIEDFEMILAARDAQLHDDIMARPEGYQGRIIEGGKDLSGGQRQRLEIARVLAQDPSIIIMDEATSALDAKTEQELVKAVKERGITCIIIAHRLSTIRDCDEIIVLDKGNVVERGTHDKLFKMNGFYTTLIASD